MGRADERRATRQRGSRRAKPKRGAGRRLFTWKKLLGALVLVGALGVGTFIVLYLLVDVPEGNAEASEQSNVYTYADGSLIARDGTVNREIVDISRVPKEIQRAFVAAENKTFYQDNGVDLRGTARALISTLRGDRQGGSTITQQYVKNYYLTQEQTVTRKAKELIIALKVDQQKSKDEILAGYLNTSYFGRGAYGVQAAAQAYYGTDVEKLTVEQGAYLAALLQAPSSYDWAVASEGTRKTVLRRWNYVLDNMVEMTWLDAGEREGMKFDVPGEPKPNPGLDGQAGYLVQAAEAELAAAGVDEQLLAARGWNIRLNIDKKKQQQLEKAVEKALLDDLDPAKRKVDGQVQPGAVSVDPATGKVLAMYGGRDFVKHYINNATRQDYQPASTFKPIILAAALDTGAETQDGAPILPTTVYDGTSERPVEGSDTPFAPPNEDDVDYGPVSVQKAMNASVNSVFAQMAVDVGLERTKQSAIELGLDAEAGGFDVKPAMSLGVMGASPLDMAAVYATLDNHGEQVTPRLIASAERDGQKIELPDPIGDQVVERETADTVTSVLQGVVNDGTASGIRSDRLNFAGKTGTSDDNKSAWFAGYTPELVTTVGLFGEAEGGKQVSMSGAAGGGRVDGGGYPAQVWSEYNNLVVGDRAAAEFDLVVDDRLAETPPPSNSPSSSDEPDPETSSSTSPPDTTTPPPPTTSSPPPTTSSPPPPGSSPPPVTLPEPEGEPGRPGREGEEAGDTG